jgi:hypothetical protein
MANNARALYQDAVTKQTEAFKEIMIIIKQKQKELQDALTLQRDAYITIAFSLIAGAIMLGVANARIS